MPGRASAKSAKPPVLRGDDLLGNRRNGWSLTGGQLGGELGAGANSELSIDLREVPLNRLGADEQGVRHLAVRASGSDEGSDPFLGRRKHAGCCGCPSPDPPQLGPSPLGPQPRAEFVEDRESLRQRFSGWTLLAIPALQRPAYEKSAPALERLLELFVELKRAVEACVRGVAVPGRGAEQRAAAARDRKRPDAARCTGLFLQLGEERRRGVVLTECQQGLDRIAVEAEQRRLAEPRFGNCAGKRAEKAMGLASLAQRVFEEPAECEHLQVGGDDADCERERLPLVGGGTRFGHAFEVRIDERPRRQCERALFFLGGLHGGLEALVGVARGELPVSGPALDPTEVSQLVAHVVLVAARE